MKKFLPIGLIVCIILIGTDASSQTEKDYDINTAMMKATFKIEGRTAQGQPTIGTAFVMGRPSLGCFQPFHRNSFGVPTPRNANLAHPVGQQIPEPPVKQPRRCR